jgi:hypothetical protein
MFYTFADLKRRLLDAKKSNKALRFYPLVKTTD